MHIDTIRNGVRGSLGGRVETRVKQGRVIDPDVLQERRRLERECERISGKIILIEREQHAAATRNAHLKKRIEQLSDGLFGAEALLNRSRLKELRREQLEADRRAKSLGQELANLKARLVTCRQKLGELGTRA